MKKNIKKIFGILAYPVHHSLSPQMHNAGFLACNRDAMYTRFGIAPEYLEKFFDDNFRRHQKISGLSVSVPHKESVIKFLDSVDETVEKIGAVNTIFWDTKNPKKLCGTNTDWKGFQKSLEEKFSVEEKSVLVLGAGGATRAIIYALEKMQCAKILLWNRSIEKAKNLQKIFPKIHILQTPEEIFSLRNDIDLVVNTTSLGMVGDYEKISPIAKNFWLPTHTAFDIVYTPKDTVFLKDCQEAGGKKISGEKMLLFQGIAQFEIFQGVLCNASTKGIMQNALRPEQKIWEVPKLSDTEKKNILHTIVEHKKTELYRSLEFWEQRLVKGEHKFLKKLQENKYHKSAPHLIAEIKPASPSKGKILYPEKFSSDSIENIATLYEKNGVSCISVLTDWKFFGAKRENLQRVKQSLEKTSNIPLLRKDFTIHPSQIFEARYLGADAVLLMRSVLDAQTIENFLQVCENLGMDALVEVHDEIDLLDVLKNTSAKIIGVNTRDLKTLKINPQNFSDLLEKAKNFLGEDEYSKKIWVAESGISSAQDIENFAQGADAILVGTGILMTQDKKKKVRELVGNSDKKITSKK